MIGCGKQTVPASFNKLGVILLISRISNFGNTVNYLEFIIPFTLVKFVMVSLAGHVLQLSVL
jgi:hypothetical protein